MADKSAKKQVRDKLIEDCFGNVAGKEHCCVLSEDVCLYRECSFYKTPWQYDADRRKYEGSTFACGVPVSHRARAVRCVELGRVYPSVIEAAKDVGVTTPSIHAVLSGRRESVRGLRFEYAEGV